MHQKLTPEKLPEMSPKLHARGLLSYSDEVGAWVYPFLGPDKAIMGRTERARHFMDGERPAQGRDFCCSEQISSLLADLKNN